MEQFNVVGCLCQGNVAMVRKLLRMGADPNTQDYAGRTGVMMTGV